jgi:hypothetical protein
VRSRLGTDTDITSFGFVQILAPETRRMTRCCRRL